MLLTINLNDVQAKALAHVIASPQEWAENFVFERARLAGDDLYAAEMARLNADPGVQTIPANKDTVILQSPLKSAVERDEEYQLAVAASQAAAALKDPDQPEPSPEPLTEPPASA
jgi:hypothetical protein